MKIGLLGYGELGRVVHEWLRETSVTPFDVDCFDDIAAGAKPFGSHSDASTLLYVCLGYRRVAAKLDILAGLNEAGRLAPAFVHASAQVSASARLESGCIVGPRSVVDCGASLGVGALLHCGTIVAHDAIVGAGAYVSPGAILCGRARVDEGAFVGAGSIVRDGVTVGRRACVGMGTAVTSDVPAGRSAIGNPMRLLARDIEL